ncbi:MAG: indolepyruvate oxidoreductase subunit beta [Lachnospiraceae bacterium]|nr:indolepyruvate oxidoreductase subunit beta [Lachnospiraceae bacterium]
MNKDILICGVGGQGTVLASRIIAAAAMAEGNIVHSAETIGMAQRGGPVTSHVRIGETAYSPLIPLGQADLIIGFEPSEVVRNLGYLKEDGLAVVNTTAVKPVTASLSDSGYDGKEMTDYLAQKVSCIFADGEKECQRLGSVKFLNILLLGIASGSGRLGLQKETILGEIEKRVPAKFREANLKAFLSGFEIGTKKEEDKEP